MFRVHVAPFVIVCEDVYGAPPLSETPLLHERVHDTSPGQPPPPTVMAGAPVAGGGDGGGGGGDGGGDGGSGGAGQNPLQ